MYRLFMILLERYYHGQPRIVWFWLWGRALGLSRWLTSLNLTFYLGGCESCIQL